MESFAKFGKTAVVALSELQKQANLTSAALLVVGGSTSEVLGHTIGTDSVYPCALAIVEALLAECRRLGINLAVQCCEHLNRALVVEREVAHRERLREVCAVPAPKAGGSFATAAFALMQDPVLVETVEADAGMDIGDTFIGMHLRRVAVPVRCSVSTVGEAHLTMARTRPPLIGGERAVYSFQDPLGNL